MVSFDFNVAYSSRWGYSLINSLKLKKNIYYFEIQLQDPSYTCLGQSSAPKVRLFGFLGVLHHLAEPGDVRSYITTPLEGASDDGISNILHLTSPGSAAHTAQDILRLIHMSSDWSVWKHANAQRKMKFAVYFVYCDCMYYLVGNLHGSDKIYVGCFVHELTCFVVQNANVEYHMYCSVSFFFCWLWVLVSGSLCVLGIFWYDVCVCFPQVRRRQTATTFRGTDHVRWNKSYTWRALHLILALCPSNHLHYLKPLRHRCVCAFQPVPIEWV